jgi:hypothetical protein
MPTITANDIAFFMSGGPSNRDPSRCIGGYPSNYEVSNGINGLLSNIDAEAALFGKTDYRCFYVANKSEENTLYGTSLHFELEDYGEIQLDLGVVKNTESQVISVNGTVFFGSVLLSFEGEQFTVVWDGSPNAFAASLTAALLSIGLEGALVSRSSSSNSHKFTVIFRGQLDNKVYPLIQLISNDLEGPSKPVVSIARQTGGRPINSVAPLLATPEVVPHNVRFVSTSPESKLFVGTLSPGDYMPVWIRRIVPQRVAYQKGSNAVIRVSGQTTGAPG